MRDRKDRSWAELTTLGILLPFLGPIAPSLAGDTLVSANQMNDEDLNAVLFQAGEGDTVTLPSGKYNFTRALKLTVNDVTIAGAGDGADAATDTILSFRGSTESNGVEARSVRGLTLEDFAVEDAVGNAVFVSDSTDVVIDSVRAEWTSDSLHSSLMAYGIYPVASDNVLVTNSVVVGARDAGIYVGQSTNIRVIHNELVENVAGIEIENCHNSLVEDNDIHGNSGGVLVFALPGAFRFANTDGTVVRNNTLMGNNRPIADTAAGFVTATPPGTGIMLMGAQNTEVTGNTITDHDTTGVLAISFVSSGFAFDPAVYDPYLRGVSVHDNTINDFGDVPGGTFADPAGLAPLVAGLFASLKSNGLPERLSAVIWDGVVDPSTGTTGAQGEGGNYSDAQRICAKDNLTDTPFVDGQISYESIDFDLLALMHGLSVAPLFPFPPRLDCSVSLPAVTGLP